VEKLSVSEIALLKLLIAGVRSGEIRTQGIERITVAFEAGRTFLACAHGL